jgi:flagellar biosynthesis/type III secretory pathway protein FliH
MNAPFNRPAVLGLARIDSARRVLGVDEVRELERIATTAASVGQRIEAAEARCLADLEATTHAAWQRGYTSGHAEAFRRLQDVLATLDQRRKAIEPQLIELVIDAIGRIARGLPAEVLLPGLIATALEEAQCERGRIVLRVHPANGEIATRWLARQATPSEQAHVTVAIDASVAENGCLLETPFGVIDAGLTTQLDALSTCLLRAAGSESCSSAVQ